MGFFDLDPSYNQVDSKLNSLSTKLQYIEPFFGSTDPYQWDEVFNLIKELQGDFKKVRYPTKALRDEAWQKFFHLRESAFDVKRKQVFRRSEKHFDRLRGDLSGLGYDRFMDFIVGEVISFGLLKETADDMKRKGQALREASADFKSVKNEMIQEHKTQIHERIVDIRASHDDFWERHRSYQEERNKIREEKKHAWEERQERKRLAKERITNNLNKNLAKRSDAENARDRFRQKRDDLYDKIYESRNENWKAKAEVWLSDLEDKISSIEEQIARLDNWIDEDQSKLSSWID